MNPKITHTLGAFAITMVLLSVNTSAQLRSEESPRPRATLPWPEVTLNQWRFDDTAWQTGTQTQPMLMNGPWFVPGWSGYALRMAGTGPSLLAFPEMSLDAKTNLPANSPATLRFWFAPDWASKSVGSDGPGEEVRLLETGAWSSHNAVTRCALVVEADGDALRLDLTGSLGAQTIARGPVHWQASEWHQVTLVSFSAGTFLYVDGQNMANGTGLALLPIASIGWTNGFCLGSDVAGGRLAQGSFDELMTFARVLAPGDLAVDFQRNAGRAALGPIVPGMAMQSSAPDLTDTNGGAGILTSNKAMLAELYGCALWLHIARSPNGSSNMVVTLHNSTPGRSYRLWSKDHLSSTTSWTLETNLVGTSNQDWTTTTVQMNQRSNLFFIATALGNFATNKSVAGLQATNSLAGNPDSMGAVGPEHFMEVLNAEIGANAIAVFDKCSGAAVQRATNTQFFGVSYHGTNYPTGRTVDARVLYDHESRRWVVCTLDLGSYNVIMAISKTNRPTDLLTNWTKYLLPLKRSGSLTDFPTLGVDKNGIYVSVSQQSGGGSTISSNIVVAIKKPEIYEGNVISNLLNVSSNELPAAAIQPGVNFDALPRGGYAWFVAKSRREQQTNYLGGAVYYRRLAWNGTNASWGDTNWIMVTSSPTYRDYFDLDEGAISAPQTNGGLRIPLDDVGSRLASAVIRDGALWTCQHVGLWGTNGTYTGNETGTNVDRSGVQWLRINIDTNGQFLSVTNGRVYDRNSSNPYWYYFPSLMVNAVGDIVTGFSGSKSNVFVGAFYSWRAADGSTPSQPSQLQPGKGPVPLNRWGDYSATTLDPIDSLTFWTVQQYSEDDASENPWGTRIAEIVPDVLSP